jgi:hypothetical protein
VRIYLTHCSKEKDPDLQSTGVAVTPDRLYTNPGICQFMEQCKKQGVQWGILSDLYGIFFAKEHRAWYSKPPDTVTPAEAAKIIADFNTRLKDYQEIFFYVRPETFHPFYKKVLTTTALADRIQLFEDLDAIEAEEGRNA